MRQAMKDGKTPQKTLAERRLAALNQGILSQEEYEHLLHTDKLKRDVIKVDDHPHDLSRGTKEETWATPKAAASM
jgi:hypothetical protein